MLMKRDETRYTSGCTNPNELPGVKKKSFILPYAGGEIWFEHLDGIYQYTGLAVEKLRRAAAAFSPPVRPGIYYICPWRNKDHGRIDFGDHRGHS